MVDYFRKSIARFGDKLNNLIKFPLLSPISIYIFQPILLIFTLYGLYCKFVAILNIQLESDAVHWGLLSYEIGQNHNYLLGGYFLPSSKILLFPDFLLFEMIPQIISNYDPTILKISFFIIFISTLIVFSAIIYKLTYNLGNVLIFSALYSNTYSQAFNSSQMIAHMGSILVCGILILLIIHILYNPGSVSNLKKYILVLSISLILVIASTYSDPSIILGLVLPITICFILFFKNKKNSLYFYFGSIAAASFVAYKFGDTIVQHILPNPPSFFSYPSPALVPIDKIIGINLMLYFQGIAYLLNNNLFLLWYSPDYQSWIILLIFALLVILTIYYLLKEKQPEAIFFYRYIFIMILVLFGSYIVTSMAVNIMTTRYLLFTALAIFLLISLAYSSKNYFFTVLILLLLLFSAAGNYSYLQNLDKNPNINQFELIDILKENNLKYGYGDYWDSNILTYLSKFDVIVRPILNSNGVIIPFNWLNNRYWYDYPSDADIFVLTKPGSVHFTQEDLKPIINKIPPKEVLHFQEYTIYVWNGSDFKIKDDIIKKGIVLKGWNEIENPTSTTLSRWMEKDAQILIPSHENNHAELSFDTISYNHDRILEIHNESSEINQFKIPTKPTHVTISINLKKGDNIITFRSPEGCERPSDISTRSKDTRCLSFAFSNISIT